MTQYDFSNFNASSDDGQVLVNALNQWWQAFISNHSGTSTPVDAIAGTIWVDTTTADLLVVKFYDGSGDITLFEVKPSTNEIDFKDAYIGSSPPPNPKIGKIWIDTTNTTHVVNFRLNIASVPTWVTMDSGSLNLGGGTMTGPLILEDLTSPRVVATDEAISLAWAKEFVLMLDGTTQTKSGIFNLRDQTTDNLADLESINKGFALKFVTPNVVVKPLIGGIDIATDFNAAGFDISDRDVTVIKYNSAEMYLYSGPKGTNISTALSTDFDIILGVFTKASDAEVVAASTSSDNKPIVPSTLRTEIIRYIGADDTQVSAGSKLVRTEAGGKVASGLIPSDLITNILFQDFWDFTGNTYPGSPVSGHFWISSTAFTPTSGDLNGVSIAVGDQVIYNASNTFVKGVVSGFDANAFFKHDGTIPLSGDLDAGGKNVSNIADLAISGTMSGGAIDGESTEIKISLVTVTNTLSNIVQGEFMFDILNKRLYFGIDPGQYIDVNDPPVYSAGVSYNAGAMVQYGVGSDVTAIWISNVAVPNAPATLDTSKWDQLVKHGLSSLSISGNNSVIDVETSDVAGYTASITFSYDGITSIEHKFDPDTTGFMLYQTLFTYPSTVYEIVKNGSLMQRIQTKGTWNLIQAGNVFHVDPNQGYAFNVYWDASQFKATSAGYSAFIKHNAATGVVEFKVSSGSVATDATQILQDALKINPDKTIIVGGEISIDGAAWTGVTYGINWSIIGPFEDFDVMKQPDGMIALSGGLTNTIGGGSSSDGTVIATLPTGFFDPLEDIRLVVTFYDTTGSSYSVGVVVIDTAGAMRVYNAPTNVEVYFGGISYRIDHGII